MWYLQLAQMVVILLSLLSVLTVLLLIRRGLNRLNSQLRRIIKAPVKHHNLNKSLYLDINCCVTGCAAAARV